MISFSVDTNNGVCGSHAITVVTCPWLIDEFISKNILIVSKFLCHSAPEFCHLVSQTCRVNLSQCTKVKLI